MMDYFDKQNEIFFDFLNETFLLKKLKTWDEISQNITTEKIKKTYRFFAELYPRNYNYLKELDLSKSQFSSLHFSDIRGNRIIDEIVRFSLYSERIIVFHPLQNPSITNQALDPRKKPKYWLPDFLEALFFYIIIQKWVKSGIVKLIINPIEYDFELREKTLSKVEERLRNFDEAKLINLNDNGFMDGIAEQMALEFKGRSKDYIIQKLLEMRQPYFSNEEAERFSDHILASMAKINPLYSKLNIPLSNSMITTLKSGGSLEAILLISEVSEANIYTPSAVNWEQIKHLGKNDFWIKMNKLYSEIDLPFLNNVDTNFALELRKAERLSGVRQELKKIYAELNSLSIENLSENKIAFLQEGFFEAIKKAEAEWIEIKKQAEYARKYWLTANAGVPLIFNNQVSLLPVIATSLSFLYFNEKNSNEKMRLQRAKNPISVFVDLKNQRQSFFSILKNSLL